MSVLLLSEHYRYLPGTGISSWLALSQNFDICAVNLSCLKFKQPFMKGKVDRNRYLLYVRRYHLSRYRYRYCTGRLWSVENLPAKRRSKRRVQST